MYGIKNTVNTIEFVACAICQAPTKTNRLYEYNNSEVCRDCAHTNDHIPNNKISKNCKHCEGGAR